MSDGLWTVWTATKSVPAHTAHSLYGDNAVVPFSIVNWSPFPLAKTCDHRP
jgi:hypothetical protein